MPLKPKFENIPEELINHPYWALWKATTRKSGKVGKPPINPLTGKHADVSDPNTFASYEETKAEFDAGDYDGLGILLSNQDHFVGADLDNCLDSKEGKQLSHDIVAELDTYSEISPSGNGIRCFGIAKDAPALDKCRSGNIEIYTGKPGGRFLTTTGHILPNRNKVNRRSKQFGEVHRRYISGKTQKSSGETNKGGVIAINRNNSPSEMDFNFCLNLARIGMSEAEIDSQFRESSLMRNKWNRKFGATTYGSRTIKKAILAAKKTPVSPSASIELLDVASMLSTEPPETEWVIPGFVPAGLIGEMIGDSTVGKSSLLFLMAFTVASGKIIPPFYTDTPKKVLLINVEDPPAQIHEKMWCLSNQINPDKVESDFIEQNLIIVDGFGKIGPLMRKGEHGNIVPTIKGEKIRSLIKKNVPALVILDTKSRLYGLEENSNDDATHWLAFLEEIVAEIGCSFVIAHHTGKGEGKISGRGASAFSNNTRFTMTLQPLSSAKAKKHGIKEEDESDYFTLDNKCNYTANKPPLCFKRGEGGIPILVDLHSDRIKNAKELLLELLEGLDLTYQQLLRNEGPAKPLRQELNDNFHITTKELINLLDDLKEAGSISFEKRGRGKGKIIINNA